MDPKTSPKRRKRLNSNTEEYHPLPKALSPIRKRKQSQAEAIVEIVKNSQSLYNFTHDFPRLSQYSPLNKVQSKFPSLKNINKDSTNINNYKNSEFYIMRSTMPDDIHKAMKYGVWTSTPEHNKILSSAFVRGQNEGFRVILFFRVVSENNLLGAAEIVSDFEEDVENDFWWNKIKWKGVFRLNWLFVGDINIGSLEQMERGKYLYELTDCSKLGKINGFFLLEYFKCVRYEFEKSLFKHFVVFDQREDFLMKSRVKTDFVIHLQKSEKKKIAFLPKKKENLKERKKSFHMVGYVDPENRKKSDSGYRGKFVPKKKFSNAKNYYDKQNGDLDYVKKKDDCNKGSDNNYNGNKVGVNARKNSFKGRKGSFVKKKYEYIKKENDLDYVKKG